MLNKNTMGLSYQEINKRFDNLLNQISYAQACEQFARFLIECENDGRNIDKVIDLVMEIKEEMELNQLCDSIYVDLVNHGILTANHHDQ